MFIPYRTTAITWRLLPTAAQTPIAAGKANPIEMYCAAAPRPWAGDAILRCYSKRSRKPLPDAIATPQNCSSSVEPFSDRVEVWPPETV
jgi:hypothetical protein